MKKQAEAKTNKSAKKWEDMTKKEKAGGITVLIVLATILGTIFASCGSSRDEPPATAPAATAAQSPTEVAKQKVLADIKAEKNCDKLQERFDMTVQQHKTASENGKLELARLVTTYMEATNSRMKEIECFG